VRRSFFLLWQRLRASRGTVATYNLCQRGGRCSHFTHRYNRHFWKCSFSAWLSTKIVTSWSQKVVGQATWLAHWWQKVGGQLPALPNRLRRQWAGLFCRLCHVPQVTDRASNSAIWETLYVLQFCIGSVLVLYCIVLYCSDCVWQECSLCEDELLRRTGVCISCDAGMCRSYFHVTWQVVSCFVNSTWLLVQSVIVWHSSSARDSTLTAKWLWNRFMIVYCRHLNKGSLQPLC